MFKQHLVFLKESLTEFQSTGTVCSTSPWAADKMVSPIQGDRGTHNILEVGAGTGAVTVKVLEHMRPGDHAMICELNPRLMKILQERLKKSPLYSQLQDQVSFFEGPIQELPETTEYDTIISSLPFLNFEVDTVKEIFEKYKRLSNPETHLTYYEYIGLRSLGQAISPPQRKARLQQLDDYFKDLFHSCRIARKRVWMNLLPINIYTLKLALP